MTARIPSSALGLSVGWTLVCLIAGLVALSLTKRHVRSHRFRAFARAHGCQAPYDDDWRWPWNIDRIYAIATARKHGKDPLDAYFVPPVLAHHTLQRTGMGGGKMFETIEPANCKTALATNFDDWSVGEDRHSGLRPVMGNNVFTSDGPFWQRSRAMLRPQFNKTLINNLEQTEENANRLIKMLMADTGPDGWTPALDLIPLITAYVTDNATEFLFGESIGALRSISSKPDDDPSTDLGKLAAGAAFMEAFDACSYYSVLRIRMQGLKFLAGSKKLKVAAATIRRVSDHYVAKTLAGGAGKDQSTRFDLLSDIAAQTDDRKLLSDQALGMLFAGRDTLVTTILWTLLLLGQHKTVFQHLREVVLAQFKNESGQGVLDFRQLKECTYLQWVIAESLRLYPPAPLNSRVAVRDTVLPTGGGVDGLSPVAVREGERIMFNVYAMHRREDLFGEDAMHFRPERWADASDAMRVRSSFAFNPFGGGPRICLGQQYALTEVAYTLVKLLLQFDDMELAADSAAGRGEPIPKKIGLTLTPTEIKIKLHTSVL